MHASNEQIVVIHKYPVNHHIHRRAEVHDDAPLTRASTFILPASRHRRAFSPVLLVSAWPIAAGQGTSTARTSLSLVSTLLSWWFAFKPRAVHRRGLQHVEYRLANAEVLVRRRAERRVRDCARLWSEGRMHALRLQRPLGMEWRLTRSR